MQHFLFNVFNLYKSNMLSKLNTAYTCRQIKRKERARSLFIKVFVTYSRSTKQNEKDFKYWRQIALSCWFIRQYYSENTSDENPTGKEESVFEQAESWTRWISIKSPQFVFRGAKTFCRGNARIKARACAAIPPTRSHAN